MASNGTYRGVYSSLVDDLDFQRLSPEARLVFHTLRICSQLGPAGIFRYYIGPLVEQTGLSERKVEACLVELEEKKPDEPYGWVVRERGVLWVVNALRHDPTMRLSDEKHKKSIMKALLCLPRRAIVLTFCAYYHLDPPFSEQDLLIKTSRTGDAETQKPTEPIKNSATYDEPTERGRAYDDPSMILRRKVDSGSPNPNPNPNPNTETDTTTSSTGTAASTPWPSALALVQKYNTETPANVPSVDTIKGNRLKKARAYLRLFPDEPWWTETFLQYHRSRFLSGKTVPSNGHQSFKPDFDWLLSIGKDGTENCVKVHDGKYADT